MQLYFYSSTTWTCPIGVTSVDLAECFGGGGAGGQAGITAGSGGGGGAYSAQTAIGVTAGTVYTVQVGPGDTSVGGTGNGGNSYFGSTGTVNALGGASSVADGYPGYGGSAADGTGTTKYSGGNGGSCTTVPQGAGGGGSSAGTTVNGNNGANGGVPTAGGAGGASVIGATTGAGGKGASTGADDMLPGSHPGGGGGGGDYAINGNGGDGASGFVEITFTYPTPNPFSISPTGGPAVGGTPVTITGVSFSSGCTVAFQSNLATSVVVVSDTSITCVTPAGVTGPCDVVITNADSPPASGTLSSGYDYTGPNPTSCSPNVGNAGNATPVTITGTNFTSGSTVTFGGNAATSVVVVGSTSITCDTPTTGSVGPCDVVVTDTDGNSGDLVNGFTFYGPNPTSCSPSSGDYISPPTGVIITGTDFSVGCTVTFGGIAATSVVVNSTTSITCNPPAEAGPGAVDVTVTSSGPPPVSGTLTNGFTYTAIPVPAPMGVTPNNGDVSGGGLVTIYGSNFTAGCTVTFNGVPATGVTFVNSTTLTCSVPVLQPTGFCLVNVTNLDGVVGFITNGYIYTNFGNFTMPGQLNVLVNLRLQNGFLVWQSQPTSFIANMQGERGPTPGSLHVPTHGIDANFSELTVPGGLCWLINIDPVNYVTYGIFDHVYNRFYPIGELLPGEPYLLRLSRHLGVEYGTGSGSGTGTAGTGDTLHFRANNAPCDIVVAAFDA